MVLQDIFDQLTHGELRQLFIGDNLGEEGLREEDKPRLIAHIQLGLTALHKRFLLKERKLTINLQEGRSTYVLKSIYSQYNEKSQELIKYIDDAEVPFKDDLLQIERVLNDKGEELPLNRHSDPKTIRTPSYNTLIVPPDLETETLTVLYRADHPKIDPIMGKAVSFREEIDLPVTHLEALLYFVASRYMNPIGLAGDFHEGNNYASKYEIACQELEGKGYQLNSQDDVHRFEDSGWI